MKSAAHIVVSGMVQGVGFRYFVRHHATQFGLTGWVRNLSNGDVELEAEGEKQSIEALLVYLRRGPGSAAVSNVEVAWKEPHDHLERFEITY